MGLQDLAELLLVLFVLAAGYAFQSNNTTGRHLAFLLAVAYAIIIAAVRLT